MGLQERGALRGLTPSFQCALSDAAFLTGLERNADIVIMTCYAPLFTRVNPGGSQWNTDLIGYDTLTSFGSPSYYVQKMFFNARGDQVIPVGEIVPQTIPTPAAAPEPAPTPPGQGGRRPCRKLLPVPMSHCLCAQAKRMPPVTSF